MEAVKEKYKDSERERCSEEFRLMEDLNWTIKQNIHGTIHGNYTPLMIHEQFPLVAGWGPQDS